MSGKRRKKRGRMHEQVGEEATQPKFRESDRIVRIRKSKKSLPGFLAKNAGAILEWLKEYESLFALADDYGIRRIDRLPPERQQILYDNYVKISDFITTAELIIAENEARNAQLSAMEISELSAGNE